MTSTHAADDRAIHLYIGSVRSANVPIIVEGGARIMYFGRHFLLGSGITMAIL